MKYDPSKQINIKAIPGNIDPLLIEQIKNDCIIICKYLNVSTPKIIVKRSVVGGMYYGRKGSGHKKLVLGIKQGYNRLVLLHELLHHKGFAHGLKQKGTLNFRHEVKHDTFSKHYLNEIFGVDLLCFDKVSSKFNLSEYGITKGIIILNQFPLMFTLPIEILNNYYNKQKEFLNLVFQKETIEVMN